MVVWKRKTINLGEQSVTELTILEWKRFFSVKLFNFHKTDGKQDRFHTHAFTALSILISGDYTEEVIVDGTIKKLPRSRKRFLLIPKDQYHRITKSNGCRTLLITGPWGEEFKELRFIKQSEYWPARSVWQEWFCGPQRKDLREGGIELLKGEL